MAISKTPSDLVQRKRGRPPKVVGTTPLAGVPATPAPFVATVAKPVTPPPVRSAIEVPAKPAVVASEPVVAATPVAIEVVPPSVTASTVSVPAPVAPAPMAIAEPAPAANAPATLATPEPASTKGPSMATTFAPSSAAVTPEGIQSMFSDIQTRAKASVEKSAKLAEEMGEFAKGNVEAVMTSGRIAAKGAETLGQEAVEYGKKSFEGAAAAFKTMIAAKSPTELFKLQSDYARSSFDAAVTEGSKLSEAWLKLFGEIAQPLSSRVALAAEKIKAPVA